MQGAWKLTIDGGTNGLVSADAMEEFRIQTSTFAPEFGRSPGASISILTKSGTNQFHGSGYYFNRNEFFAAQNPFLTTAKKAKLRNVQFGGS